MGAGSGGEDGADDGLVAVDLKQSEGAGAAEGEGAGSEAEDAARVGADGGVEVAASVWADLEAGARHSELEEPAADLVAGLADLAHLPTLIVWGDADIAFRPQERERLEATFTDHKAVIVEGAGTYVESDAPEEFVAAIRAWAATQRGDASRAGATDL